MKKMNWWFGRKTPAQTPENEYPGETDGGDEGLENSPDEAGSSDDAAPASADSSQPVALPEDNTGSEIAAPADAEMRPIAPYTDGGTDAGVLQEGAHLAGKTKKRWSKKKIVALSIVGALVLILVGAGAWVLSIMADPMAQFNQVAEQITPHPSVSQDPADPADTQQPDAEPTIDPYEALLAQADTGFLKDIVNIMLIGVDHAEERDTWSGKKAFHSDVMIVLSVNKATGDVNMISLPRDTYAKIPDIDGIYKLNASIDCGGGWPSEANNYSMSGFEKVCESAEWMLGGIPVEYYYAVDMNAVKGLVDTIGGVQGFDVDMDFKMQGRSYTKGVQDMNGQAVLDYLRVRKGVSEAGDLNRINRQKKMLVAIFDKIKKNGLLASVPSLLDAFDGNLYTNTTLAQTAALAAFGYNVNADDIGMYSMGGKYNYGIFNWNFVLTDQKARVELIEKIYGVKVGQYKDYTASAAVAKWNRMQVPVVRKGAQSVLSKVKSKLDADAKLPIYGAATPTPPVTTPTPPVTTPTPPATTPTPPATTPTPPATTPTPVVTPTPTPPATTEGSGEESAASAALLMNRLVLPDTAQSVTFTSGAPKGYRQYLPNGPEWALYNKCANQVNSLSSGSVETVKTSIESLCRMFSVGIPNWKVNYESSNDVVVDFR